MLCHALSRLVSSEGSTYTHGSEDNGKVILVVVLDTATLVLDKASLDTHVSDTP